MYICSYIDLSEFVAVPRFLRFNQVRLEYRGSQSIAQKCEYFLGHLPSIKASLDDSNITEFYCDIDHCPGSFSNHSTLIERVREVVSICDSSRGYFFDLNFHTMDSNVPGHLISSILEMPAIARSATVSLRWKCIFIFGLTQLPVETISNWLNRERRVMNQNQRELRLKLMWMGHDYANIQQMCDFLKRVSFLFPNI